MKRGIEYAFSDEKRWLDRIVAAAMTPPGFAARILLGHLLRNQPGEDSNPLFQQERDGMFNIHKLRTMNSNTGEPLNRTAALFRRYGIDELAQARDIKAGHMSAVGYRPLPLDLRSAVREAASDEVLEQWDRVVLPTRPGGVSTFSLVHHQESVEKLIENADVVHAADINDVAQGCLTYDLALIGRVFAAAAKGEL